VWTRRRLLVDQQDRIAALVLEIRIMRSHFDVKENEERKRAQRASEEAERRWELKWAARAEQSAKVERDHAYVEADLRQQIANFRAYHGGAVLEVEQYYERRLAEMRADFERLQKQMHGALSDKEDRVLLVEEQLKHERAEHAAGATQREKDLRRALKAMAEDVHRKEQTLPLQRTMNGGGGGKQAHARPSSSSSSSSSSRSGASADAAAAAIAAEVESAAAEATREFHRARDDASHRENLLSMRVMQLEAEAERERERARAVGADADALRAALHAKTQSEARAVAEARAARERADAAGERNVVVANEASALARKVDAIAERNEHLKRALGEVADAVLGAAGAGAGAGAVAVAVSGGHSVTTHAAHAGQTHLSVSAAVRRILGEDGLEGELQRYAREAREATAAKADADATIGALRRDAKTLRDQVMARELALARGKRAVADLEARAQHSALLPAIRGALAAFDEGVRRGAEAGSGSTSGGSGGSGGLSEEEEIQIALLSHKSAAALVRRAHDRDGVAAVDRLAAAQVWRLGMESIMAYSNKKQPMFSNHFATLFRVEYQRFSCHASRSMRR
jgi:hypothetical protein